MHAGSQPQTNAAIVVFARDNGRLTPADRAVIVSARSAVLSLAGHVSGLAAPSALQPSADGQAAVFTVDITGSASSASIDRDGVKAIRAAIAAPASRAPAGLADAVTGSAAVNADTSSGNQKAVLLLTALIIVAIILLLVYRSPILWLLPLASAISAIMVAQASAHGLANTGLTVSSLSADILIVLVFGAASDYALLLVHRYREELRQYATPEGAMAAALRATLPTVIASAATVTCAMLCLLTADSASLHGLGPVGAVSVAALLAQITSCPRCCSSLGGRHSGPAYPGKEWPPASSRDCGRASASGLPAIPRGQLLRSSLCSAPPARALPRCTSTTTPSTTSRAARAA